MSIDKHERQYQAYQALKDLSEFSAETMKQIAYQQLDHIDWDDTCRRHRAAFARWIEYADSQRVGEERALPQGDSPRTAKAEDD